MQPTTAMAQDFFANHTQLTNKASDNHVQELYALLDTVYESGKEDAQQEAGDAG